MLAIGLLVAGCSSDTGSLAPTTTPVPARATTPAAEPATAGAPAVPPVGKVVPIGNAPEGIVIGTSRIGAVAVRNPRGVEVIDAATGAVRQTVPTVGAARHLSLAGPDGPVLVPLERSNELCELTLADGRMTCAAAGVGGDVLARLIEIRTFDYEDQFIADVLMTRQLRAGIEARQRNASLGLLVVPDRFLAYPGHRIDPGDFAEVDVLRRRSAGQVARRLNAAGDDRQHGRAILAADAVDASVRTIADISGRASAVFVGD